jgi:hypothetical protein
MRWRLVEIQWGRETVRWLDGQMVRWLMVKWFERDGRLGEIHWRYIKNPNARLPEDLSGGQAKAQMANEVQMSKFKGQRPKFIGFIEFIELVEFIETGDS